MSLTAWNGHITAGPLHIPNWLVLLGGVVVSVLAWLQASDLLKAKPAMLIISSYMALHTMAVMAILGSSGRGAVGIGVVLAAVCVVLMFVAVLRKPSETSSAVGAAQTQ